jgi:hypothetical protein
MPTSVTGLKLFTASYGIFCTSPATGCVLEVAMPNV